MRKSLTYWAVGFIVCAALFVSIANAQQGASAPDEQKLVEKIKEAVMKELRESDFLSQQIELGIQNYIKKQQQAQAAARAEEERQANEKAKQVRRVSAARDHIYGNPNAPVSLIEYSDFECPFCKRFHATANEIVDAYGGKVNWVYRHFPLSMHNPGAQKEAEASECVAQLGGNDAFWKFANAIYARTKSNGNGFPLDQLVPLGKEMGLDERQFKECIDGMKYASRVQEDLDEGAQIGITGTPANFLLRNDTGEVILKVGAQPAEAIKPDIDKLLGK
ncbi:MAG TPA: DsbA family protein [Candidatus Acidoferrales bacterium]|nr:DsbA family protein [Candidatus Acidoferrales bacterium]